MSRKCTFVVLILATTITFALCGSVWTYQEITVTDGGIISGTVQFVGPVPKLEPIKVVKDQETCGNEVPSEVLIVNTENKGLKNTVVYLEKIEQGKKIALNETALDNHECRFVPHVLAVLDSRTVREFELPVKNSDPILHNTHSYLEGRTVFNLALPNQGQVIKRSIKKPGVIRVQCDAHVHMSAWIVALGHPYFTVTDENGNFKIDDIPPGNYRIIAWHEPWKIQGEDKGGRLLYEPEDGVTLVQEITVPAKGEAKVRFEFQ
jgi:hypothetical protein